MTRPRPFPGALRLVHLVDVAGAGDGERIDTLLGAGVTSLWLRDPVASGHALYEAAGALLLRCRRLGAALLIGDRVDVALAVGADGVALGHRGVPVRAVRPWYTGWIGASCHNASELAAAIESGADHVVVSPVFGVPAKGPPLGVEGLARLAEYARVPVLALGGLSPDNVPLLRGLPLAGVAAIRSLRDAPDPASAARRMAARG